MRQSKFAPASLAGLLAFMATLTVSTTHAQETGFTGFLHRAGAAVSRTATAVTGNAPAGSQRPNPLGVTTSGAYYRPIRPAQGAMFPGLFSHYRPGIDSFPRVALTFTRFGASEPCWTVEATIWRSTNASTVETLDICNATIVTLDDLGNPATVNSGEAMGVANGLLQLQNVEGSSHARSTAERATGPLPPQMLFQVQNTGPNALAFSTQYREILFRLAWLSGFVGPQVSETNLTSTIGKSMWTRFDPAGNLDRRTP